MRVLHLLSQRPGRTGSGVTLESLATRAAREGLEQWAVVGTPLDDPRPSVAGIEPQRLFPLVFGRGSGRVEFPLPGMSDVMPYPSSRFSALGRAQLEAYRTAWRDHLRPILEAVAPDVIHSHHVWLLSSLIKDIAPGVPVVNHCHATGLRQMSLCPELAPEVRAGCVRNDAFAVLTRQHTEQLVAELHVPRERISIVGAGFDTARFFPPSPRGTRGETIVYAGKYSHSKGLPWLLDAFERLRRERPALTLHIAGAGAGPEAEALARRIDGMPGLQRHGMLSQEALGSLLRSCAVFVLPSFYEGLPLVLIEALACGCRPVATALPGVVAELAPALGDALELIPLPRLRGIDLPEEADLPAFVEAIHAALERALVRAPIADAGQLTRDFSWDGVYTRVRALWDRVIG